MSNIYTKNYYWERLTFSKFWFSKVKVGLSPSKEKFFYLLQWEFFKMMRNAFYFILKALFVFKIFIYGYVEETA